MVDISNVGARMGEKSSLILFGCWLALGLTGQMRDGCYFEA